jgi:signal peptidase I
MSRKRRPWLAALLSLLHPGFGHLYAGHPAAGLGAYVTFWCAFLFMLAMGLWAPGGPIPLLLGFLTFVVAFPVIALHAWRLARRPAVEYRSHDRWAVFVILVLLSVELTPPLWRQLKHRVEAFRVPSGSMEPTLLIGDFLWMVKTPAARTKLAHGSIVIFESVEEPGLKVVKRVAGLPGDTLSMSSGVLHRNGRPVAEGFVIHTDKSRSEDLEQRGRMHAWQVAHAVALDTASYAPDVQNWGPLVVPPDSFFALGDNRDRSYDSRYYGFLPMSKVIGKPRAIYFSVAKDSSGSTTGFRWSRIGSRVE